VPGILSEFKPRHSQPDNTAATNASAAMVPQPN
jgi:hypothetical protein